MEKAET